MKIFFDFDDFFLRTEDVFVTDFFRFLARVTGATQEEIRQTFGRFSGAGFSRGLPYAPERHIDFLSETRSFDVMRAKEQVKDFCVDLEKYCFPGAEEFLQCFEKENLYLLTFGEADFQNRKVDGSGLRKYFRDVITTEGNKLDEIQRIAQRDNFSSNEKIVFSDNRCGHFIGMKEVGIVTIHLKRETDKYSLDPCNGCQYRVDNFDDLLACIQRISSE